MSTKNEKRYERWYDLPTSNVSSKKTNNEFDIETHNKLVTEYLLVNEVPTLPPQKTPKTKRYNVPQKTRFKSLQSTYH